MSNEPTDQSTETTKAYRRKQIQGIQFSVNRCWAACEDSIKNQKSADDRVKKLEAAFAAAQIEIGRHTDEIAELKDRIDKAGKVVRELQKGKQ